MKTNLHLSFNGDCREAFNHYANHLGGTPEFMPYDAKQMCSESFELPPGAEEKVMHAELAVGDITLMGADALGDDTAFPYRTPQGFDIVLGFDDLSEARRVFDALADGGTTRMPLDEIFFARAFGSLTDRFGIHWNIIVPHPDA